MQLRAQQILIKTSRIRSLRVGVAFTDLGELGSDQGSVFRLELGGSTLGGTSRTLCRCKVTGQAPRLQLQRIILRAHAALMHDMFQYVYDARGTLWEPQKP